MIYYPTTANFVQKTLNSDLLAGVIASASLNNVTSIQNKKGVMIIDRIDTNGNETPSKVEVIAFDGTSGSTVVTLTRGLAGTSDQVHAVGAIVEFGPDIVWAQGLIDSFEAEHNDDGTHSDITATSVTTDTITAETTDAYLDLNGNGTGGVDVNKLRIAGAGVVVDGITDEDDMASDSATKVPTQQSVKAYVDNNLSSANTDGWTADTDTWVYVSASTFKIEGKDVTARFPKGTRLKFTQTTTKYAVVVDSAFSTDTTITIAVNTDYTIANAAITSPYYSYAASPQGYPSTFAFTPSWGNITMGSATTTGSYSVFGKIVSFSAYLIYGASFSIGNSPTLTLPIAISNAYTTFQKIGDVTIYEDAVANYDGAITKNGRLFTHTVSGSNIIRTTISSSVPIGTWSANDGMQVNSTYQMA